MRQSVLKVLYGIAIAVLVFSSWTLYVQSRIINRQLAEYQAATAYPLLTTSLLMDFSNDLEPMGKHGAADQLIDRKLIFVLSDRCKHTENNIPRWQSIVDDLTPTDGVHVVFITFDTAELVEPLQTALEQRRVPFSTYRIRRKLYFSLRTGLSGTPSTLLVTRDNRPLVVHTGELQDAQTSAFRSIIHDRTGMETIGGMFLKDTTPTTPQQGE